MSPRLRAYDRRPRLTWAAPVWLALATAGCALTPAYERPPAPVAERFPAPAVPAAEAGTPAPLLAWQDFLQDARTRALVALALERNRDLRVALLNVEQARALLGVQQADRLPTVGVGAGVERSSTASFYSAGLVMSSFELDLFGRVKSLSEAAAARVLASEEARRAVALSLIGAVADTELALRADDERIAITQQVLDSRADTLRLVRIKFDGGVSAEPELRANESLVAGARATLIAQQRQRAQRLNALELLVGGPLPAALPQPQPLLAHRLPDLPAGLPAEVLLQRPDVRQAEQLLIAAHANIGAARAAFFPRIALTGSLGVASTDLSALFDNGVWGFTGQLLQPLFDAGRNRANLAGAEAARDIAVAQYERAIQSAFREVADTLAGRETLGAQLQAQREQAQAETRRLAAVQRLLDNGAASVLDRLDVERLQLAARLATVELELALRQNAVLLYRVLGGGTALPVAPAAPAATAANGVGTPG